MREIKFRAWDETKKEMTSSFDITSQGVIVSNFNKRLYHNDYALIQYTGLKDKNGVEIYEGDVVIGVLYKDYCAHIGQIKFDFNGYRIVTKDKSMPLDLTEKLTVIGNIYENPELLK